MRSIYLLTKALTILLAVFFCLHVYGQIDPKKGMTYDKENKLYYKVSNDKENLYVSLYKDEYARKVEQQGGVRLFFNFEGKRDTSAASVVQYPIYQKRPKGATKVVKWEEIAIDRFSNIQAGTISVYNEYGITAEAELKAVEGKGNYDKKGDVFTYKLSVPLQYVPVVKGNKMAVCIFLKGWRPVPIPPGGVSPILNSISLGTESLDQKQYMLELDTWTHSWIDYQLK